MQTSIAQDREIKNAHIAAGDPCKDIPKSHEAYPLIPKKVVRVIINPCTHFLNGCIHDVESMNVDIDRANYRNTGVYLNKNMSLRGTSKNEALHSVMDKALYISNNMRALVYDAKALWIIIHFNRRRQKKMGKHTLPLGVAPMEASDCPPLVKSTKLKFGFDYYYHVQQVMEQEIDDAVLEKLDAAVVQDIDDVAAADLVPDYYSEEGVTDADTTAASAVDNTSCAINEELKIPDKINFDTLQDFAILLDDAAVDPDYDDGDDMSTNTCGSAGGTLQDCAKLAHKIGEANNFDMELLYGGGDGSLPSHDNVKSRRNVALRKRQNQSASSAKPPDFNEAMKKKWLEIWGATTNPSDGRISTAKWVKEAMIKYRVWMFEQMVTAEEHGQPPPLLFSVSVDTVTKWVQRMKSTIERPLTAGAFTESSAQLGESFDSYVATTDATANASSFDEETAIGFATKASELQLSTMGEGENIFMPPKSDVVSTIMPKPAKKKIKEIDHQLIARRATAKRNMDEAEIQPDQKMKRKRRCNVCDKYYDFKFRDVPHGRNNGFCPLADDHAIYHDKQAAKVDARKAIVKKYNQKKRRRKDVEK